MKNRRIIVISIISIISILSLLLIMRLLEENRLIINFNQEDVKSTMDENFNIIEDNESNIEFTYKEISRNNPISDVSITVKDNENGLQCIEFLNDNYKINCYGKKTVSIDRAIEVGEEVDVKVTSISGEEKNEKILLERYEHIIIQDGVLIDENYYLIDSNGGYLIQREGYVEYKAGALKDHKCGLYWEINTEEKLYSKLKCKISNPIRSSTNAAGGYIFVGTGPVRDTGDTEKYVDSKYLKRVIGNNGYNIFTTPIEINRNFTSNPETTFYVGLQMYYRANYAWYRTFYIYDLIIE